ncbi:MAG: MFS transporter [Promethearchaeota archaeon]
MPITRIKKTNIIPIIIVTVLLFISWACTSMLIPSYGIIGEEFGIPEGWFTVPDAFFILISAVFALIWGYFADKVDRIKVLMAGALLWTFGMFFTYFSDSYEYLLLSRAISGAGLGCVLPIGYSVIADAIPPDERSGWFGLLAILSSVSNATGQALSSFLGPLLGWKFPFLLLSIISMVIIFLLFFAKMPRKGASEGELIEITEMNLEYKYKISKKELKEIINNKTNKSLIIQGFFAIVPGTVLIYYLTTLLRNSYFFELPDKIKIQTSTIFAGLVGIGYILGNLIFSYFGDVLFKKNKKNRARLATFCMFLSIPFALGMFFSLQVIDINVLNAIVHYPTEIPNQEVGHYMILTLIAIFTSYPSYIYCFFFSLIASILAAGPVANKNAVMIDINMPEHKGTAASLFNLSEQVGKGLTLLLASWLIFLFSEIYDMMVISIFFWVPGAIFWILASRSVKEEMETKSKILSERSQVTLLDHVFEMEVEMDKAIQKVQDSKYYIETNVDKFYQLLDESLKIFKYCEHEGETRSITNIEKKAAGMRKRVISIKHDVKKIYKELKKDKISDQEKDALREELSRVRDKINIWGRSTFGELQTYSESAYLKVVEAKILHNRDLLKSLTKINDSIVIYHRVKHLLGERLAGVEKSKLSKEEIIIYNKEIELFEKCKRSLNATVKLKEEIQNVIKQLNSKGIHIDDLTKISELTLEYQVNLHKVIADTFGQDNKTRKAIEEILNKIDQIFENYDQWKEEDFKIF